MANKYWQKYETGMSFIIRKSLITRTNRNWDMYVGNQWKGCETGKEELPSLNFIKPTIKHKVSTISQNNMVANYSDLEGREKLAPIYKKLNALFSACWEKANMDMQLWALMKDAAVTGDGVLYFGTKDVEDVQRLNNTAILYGDESQPDIQKQPYIIIVQRLAVDKIKEIARENGVDESEIAQIVPDQATENIVGNREEVQEDANSKDSKATCIIYMEKKDGIVHVVQCTKAVIFEPYHPIASRKEKDGKIQRGMNLYPIVKISWEDFPNSARGLSEVEQLIPNQLEINKTLARRSLIIKLTAFPRIAYDSNTILNPQDLEKVGAPIEVSSGGAQSINQAIAYLNPAQSNSDPKNYADDLLSLTQELSGSGETAMGNINPNRVAASAIIAIRDQAALPLNEQVAKKTTCVEDLAKLWVEIWAVYHPEGMDVVIEELDEETGKKVQKLQNITKEDWDKLKVDVRIDTSQDNPWTKEAEQNWLDGALDKGHISFEEYIKASPDNGIVPKNKMLSMLEERAILQQQQEQMAMQQIEQDAIQKWSEQDGIQQPQM